MAATLQKCPELALKMNIFVVFIAHSLMPMRLKHSWRTYSVTVSKKFTPTDQVIKI